MTEPTKVCTRCTVEKPWGEYHATTKWPDGSMRRPQSRCKACQRTLVLERYHRLRRQDPERLRVAWRQKYRRLREDPERWASRNAYERDYYRAYRSPNPTPERWKDARPTGVTVPCAPVAEAIERSGLEYTMIAERAGIDEACVRRMFKQATTSPERASLILDACGILPSQVGL